MARQRVMTDEKQEKARSLYEGGMRPSEIAREIGVNDKSFRTWINNQEWYERIYRSKAQRVMTELKTGTMDPAKANPVKQIGRFVIPWRLPGLNEYIACMNKSRFRGNDLKKKTEEDIALCASIGLSYHRPYDCAVHLNIHFVESNCRRDYDNIQTGQKFILDALQSIGVIENDGQSYVLPSQYAFSVDPDYPRVEVEIVPHPDKPIPQKRVVRREEKRQEPKLPWVLLDGKKIVLQMDCGEILRSYEQAADKKQQIMILADLNAVSPRVIRQIIAGA